jgi:hypothetical protein
MIVAALLGIANAVALMYVVRENRRLTNMVIARHAQDLVLLNNQETRKMKKKKDIEKTDKYSSWRNPSEGVGP